MLKTKFIKQTAVSVVVLGLIACTGESEGEQVLQKQQSEAELKYAADPSIYPKVEKLILDQKIGAATKVSEGLVYPTIRDFYEGTNHNVIPDYLVLRKGVCSADKECLFFMDLGYAYKEGHLFAEIEKNDQLAGVLGQIEEASQSPDLNNQQLRFALGYQPYKGSPYSAMQSSKCTNECKTYIAAGLAVGLKLSNALHRQNVGEIALKADVALGRIGLSKPKTQGFVQLKPEHYEEPGYAPEYEEVLAQQRAHTYADRLQNDVKKSASNMNVEQQVSQVETTAQPVDAEQQTVQVESVPKSVRTYADKIEAQADAKQASEVQAVLEKTKEFRIVRRDQGENQGSQPDDEYIVIY